MDGKKILEKLNRLSNTHDTKDIKQLTAALFPGSHCPLMGAMMAIGGIDGALMLVLGTDECTYYAKKATINGFNFEGLDNRCFSIAINQHDVTFGCKDMLYDAFEELMSEEAPKAIFLVTTCVLEVTGDDIDSMARELEGKYNIPILPVHTEHFKTANHLPGVRDTITACFNMMNKNVTPVSNRVNVIGQRLGKFTETELYKELVDRNIEIGMMLPGGSDVETIRNAASASVNIVVHSLGLPLAKKMEKELGTPYVLFDKFVNPDHVLEAYTKLFNYLDLELDEKIMALYEESKRKVEKSKDEVYGMKYVYGNTALACFEYNAFMVSLGMEPQIIQTNEINEEDKDYIDYVLSKYDPYVTKTANIAPLQFVYDEINPNLYLGHEFAMRLRQKGIALVSGNDIQNMLGFEVTMGTMTDLVNASREAKLLEEKRRMAS